MLTGASLRIRETVLCATPAAAATAFIVTARPASGPAGRPRRAFNPRPRDHARRDVAPPHTSRPSAPGARNLRAFADGCAAPVGRLARDRLGRAARACG